MSWDEAKYTIKKVLAGIERNQITGIPPRNMETFSANPGDKKVTIRVKVPDNTIVDNQLLCTVAGVKVIRKTGSIPLSPEDGTLILTVTDKTNVTKYIDTNVTNGVTYYYGFFPYSDHGVYNFNQSNIIAATPTVIHFWAFDQDFSNKAPASTITYPTGFQNSSFAKMLTNEGTGTATAGGWLDFLQNTLKNYPFMVKSNGEADYMLDPSDYSKKALGESSDYNNTSYAGGAFAWLNKIYMYEEYSSDGEKREVQFADGPADGFTPVGFYDFDHNELEGVWLPMGYMNSNGKTLVAGTTPCASLTCDSEYTLIKSFSQRAVFLGGPILRVLRDLEYMLFKSTDIQLQAGHGRCKAGSNAVTANISVANGNVPGWKGTNGKTTMNKYFHSQVLGSYQQWIRDPYTITINGKLYASPYYEYDLTGAKYVDTGITLAANSAWWYASHLISMGDAKLGSMPKQENTASTSTGLCDGGPYGNASGTRVALSLGNCSDDLMDGPASVNLYYEASAANWNCGVGVLLLPSVDYAPTVQN
jgi:hypothetical protein